MKRKEEYHQHMMKYLTAFAKISGLKYNIGKTKVIPIGDFDKENVLCPGNKLYWNNDFTLLVFYIDNKLEKLNKNLDIINQTVINLINKWK